MLKCRPVQKPRLQSAHSTARISVDAPSRSTRPGLDRSGALVVAAVDMETVAVEDMGANVGAEDIRMWVRYVVEAPVSNNLAFR